MAHLTRSHLARTIFLGTCLLLAGGHASAQWVWVDAGGKKVFSDTAPPAGTADKNILKRPHSRATAAEIPTPDAEPAPAAAATTPPPALKPSGVDTELQARRKKAEEAEATKARAEQERLAKARTENCDRAKRAKATLESGVRLATVNAQGEREIMDDKGRSAEQKRLEDIVRSDCGPLPKAATTAQ